MERPALTRCRRKEGKGDQEERDESEARWSGAQRLIGKKGRIGNLQGKIEDEMK